jgi:PAS domain-containing protein
MAAEQERESRIIVLPARLVRLGEAEVIIANLQLLPEPVWLSAIDGAILKANAAALELIKADKSELIGKAFTRWARWSLTKCAQLRLTS